MRNVPSHRSNCQVHVVGYTESQAHVPEITEPSLLLEALLHDLKLHCEDLKLCFMLLCMQVR